MVTFEMTILFAGISAVFGMLALNGLPMPYHPVFNVPRFAFATKDRFFLIVFSSDAKYDAARNPPLSGELVATLDFGGAQLGMLRLRKYVAMRGRCLPATRLLICLLAWRCRQDMHDQPRFKPLAESDFFADLRSARTPVEGTVARGQLHEDTYFYTGKIGNNPGDYMPFPVTEEVLARGRERFNIYCAPCHSRVGDGNGMIVQRGFRASALVSHRASAQSAAGILLRRDDQWIRRDAGLRVADSAARSLGIVAYIRALQLSQKATWPMFRRDKNFRLKRRSSTAIRVLARLCR